MAEDQVFQQDLDQEMPDFHKLIWMQLLFREAPERPSPQAVQDALAERFGEVDTVSTGGIYSYAVRRFPVEYNNGTVPAQVLGQEELEDVKPDCLILDLASKPGGVDLAAAGELGLTVVWALSLPGKVAPVTAGAAIRNTIYNMLREIGM